MLIVYICNMGLIDTTLYMKTFKKISNRNIQVDIQLPMVSSTSATFSRKKFWGNTATQLSKHC